MPPARPKKQPLIFRSGFVALLGRPNVGKSTLLNQLVGQKIAITSAVMQTTRHRIKGIVTRPDGQVIFLDTPGFAKTMNAQDQLGHYLTDEGKAALNEADVFLVVVDGTEPPGRGDKWILEQAVASQKPVLMIMNKLDRLKDSPKYATHKALYEQLAQSQMGIQVPLVVVSAKTGKFTSKILEKVVALLPEGPAYYDTDAVTDQRLREIAAEMIREQVLHLTSEEIPHSVAVGIDRFEENQPSAKGPITRITASLYVDQDSQKPILIGQQGQMIKQIGLQARKQIETLMEGPVHLALEVKVKKNWRRDPKFLQSLGLAPPSHAKPKAE